jgi:serine/threonine protein kinase
MAQQILSQGTVLGERFQIEKLAGRGELGDVYKAIDIKLNKPISLRVIPKALLPGKEDVDRLRKRVKEASQLTHRNIRATFGMGIHEDQTVYIAAEWIEGQNLRVLLKERIEDGKRFSYKGAYNIIGHVCNALANVHPKAYHGALSPRTIMINNAGRVKVGDFALSTTRTNITGYRGRDKIEASFWAPEVFRKETGKISHRSDIYSIGALFYELITGAPPQRPLKAPSALGFSKDVDEVIAKCMAPDPAKRFSDTATVKSAIAKLVEAHATDDMESLADDDLGINVEIDLNGMAATRTSVKPKSPEPAIKLTASSDPSSSGSMLNAPGLPPPPDRNRDLSGDGRVSTIDMGEVLSGLSTSEAARWMVQKDKFDHGPFTDRELVQMILLGEVQGKHQLLNMDSGVRKKVRAWGDFDAYLERYRVKKKEQEELAARQRMEKAEKTGTFAKWMIVLIVLGVIGLGAAAYLLSRTLRKEKTYTPEEMVAALDSGEIKLKTGGNLIRGKRGGRGGRHRGGGGGGSGGGRGMFVDGMTYEEAMNMGVSLGSMGDNKGQQQLTPQTITNIMDRNVRRFLPCMAGQSVKKVEMNIAISGDGRVMGVSVNQGDARLQKCVTAKVRSIKFPTSSAPRTAASWYFELY